MLATSEQERARALGAFALLLCAGLTAGCATADAPSPAAAQVAIAESGALDPAASYALFIGRVAEVESADMLDCGEGNICMTLEYRLRIEPLEVLAGNPNLGAQSCTVYRHAAPARDIPMNFRASRNSDGDWVVDCSALSR